MEKAAGLFERQNGIRVEIDVVELPEAQQVLRGTAVGMLSFAEDTEAAKKFMDFLTTPEAREYYKDFGWVVPDD